MTALSAAERARRHRALEREGRRIIRAAVREHEFADALIESGRLSEDEAGDPDRVAQAAADILEQWAAEIISQVRHA